MAQGLQELIAMAQGAQGKAAPAPAGNDPMAALQALLGGGGAAPAPAMGNSGAGMMQQAIRSLMGSGLGIDPPNNMGVGGGPGRMSQGNPLAQMDKASLGGDSDYYEINEANQGVRGDLPIEYNPDYTGFSDDMVPLDDPRQTPMPSDQSVPDGPYTPHAGEPGFPGQANMGAYLKAKKGMSTEDELADVSNKMGADGEAGPVRDGKFPSARELKALNDGSITPADFDAKWGKGASKEMMEDTDGDGDIDKDDEGDHEYR